MLWDEVANGITGAIIWVAKGTPYIVFGPEPRHLPSYFLLLFVLSYLHLELFEWRERSL